jgi:hypothetical protein
MGPAGDEAEVLARTEELATDLRRRGGLELIYR